MDIFLLLFFKLLPLYCIIFLGFIAARFFEIRSEGIAPLLIYILSPVVVSLSLLKITIIPTLIYLPFATFIFGALTSIFFWRIGIKVFKDSTANILGFTAGTGNTGYFGIPVCVALYGSEGIGYLMFLVMGVILYEYSIGYYITARGQFSTKESLIKVFKLPALYAFFGATILNLCGVRLSTAALELSEKFVATYSVLGMMLIGIGLGSYKILIIDYKFISLTLIARFIVWPFLMLFSIFIIEYLPDAPLNSVVKGVILLAGSVPLAANTVAFAATLNAQPEKAAVAVFVSTMVAVVVIPIVMNFL